MVSCRKESAGVRGRSRTVPRTPAALRARTARENGGGVRARKAAGAYRIGMRMRSAFSAAGDEGDSHSLESRTAME
ncbi:hypothetical protein GCM10027570_34650 [Streptomonospora sediminis]